MLMHLKDDIHEFNIICLIRRKYIYILTQPLFPSTPLCLNHVYPHAQLWEYHKTWKRIIGFIRRLYTTKYSSPMSTPHFVRAAINSTDSIQFGSISLTKPDQARLGSIILNLAWQSSNKNIRRNHSWIARSTLITSDKARTCLITLDCTPSSLIDLITGLNIYTAQKI